MVAPEGMSSTGSGAPAEIAAWQHQMLNNYINAGVTGLFLVLVILVTAANARVWWQLLRGQSYRPLQEEPFVPVATDGNLAPGG
jgi:carbon starvation protein